MLVCFLFSVVFVANIGQEPSLLRTTHPLRLEELAEATALEDVDHALVEVLRTTLISLPGARSTPGTRRTANALCSTRAEETPTPSTRTETAEATMWVSGRSMITTGTLAAVERLLAT